jgi:hypothetical protein
MIRSYLYLGSKDRKIIPNFQILLRKVIIFPYLFFGRNAKFLRQKLGWRHVFTRYKRVLRKKSSIFLLLQMIPCNFAGKILKMDKNRVINRQQPGSISWAAFLKIAALLPKPPTIFWT